ncbi:paxillin-B isoform X2 [Cephus cinctus]|uniref:Paxillin-B isoform X2 n=1 Tax=Cephus cinctus TaxID=211228 RepID=A0AAJ7CBT0_CEPCN|nr:paxillin-B isoform X2 [Cephus cinctus]
MGAIEINRILHVTMGLLFSALIGCVGILELLACLRKIKDDLKSSLHPPAAPCLSYHGSRYERLSSQNSLCSCSHVARNVQLSRGAIRKLENLHEYGLRVKSELRSLDEDFDDGTLSDCSTGYVLDDSRPDSALGLEDSSLPLLLVSPPVDKYVRIPTPIPFALGEDISRSSSLSNSSVERGSSFENESGNEAPTRESFDKLPPAASLNSLSSSSSLSSQCSTSSHSHSHSQSSPSAPSAPSAPSSRAQHGYYGSTNLGDHVQTHLSEENEERICYGKVQGEPFYWEPEEQASLLIEGRARVAEPSKSSKSSKQSTTILRKATRLKSRNADVSKSAENLTSTRKSRRQREPERRKSDISVQTANRDSMRDESTNTSPPLSPSVSRSHSKESFSVEVQTSFDDQGTKEHYVCDGAIASGSKGDLTYRKKSSWRSLKGERPNGKATTAQDDALDADWMNVVWMGNAIPSFEETQSTKLPPNVSRFREANENDYEAVKGYVAHSEGRRVACKDDAHEEEDNENEGEVRNRWGTSLKKEDGTEDEFLDADEGSFPVSRSSSTGKLNNECRRPDSELNKAFWLIFSGEYTKAMNKDWHSGHFCCWQCDESLTGQRYVLRDEHPYCIKCYESVFANACEECNKIIGIDSKDLSYKDKHWHEACFLCNKCRVSLVDKQFGSKLDKIYCGNCYDAQFASRCDGCGEIFRAGTKKMEYKTRQWHEKCFCCVVCKNPIGTKSFIPREQEIYCAGCYEDKFATRCVKCNKIITSGGVTYKNEPWHRDCFTCSNCSTSLAGQRFTSRDEKPYCADCFGELFAKRCTACTKPITGIGGTRFISFEDRHWHNDCFICAGCRTSLVGRGFITDGDDIICPECAKQKLM